MMPANTFRLRALKFLEEYEQQIPFLKLCYIFKDHKNPFHLFATAKDYLQLKRSFAPLQQKPGAQGKKILFVSLTNFIYQVKLEAMLAAGLQANGSRVYMLTWDHFFWPKRYFNAFGLSQVLYFDDYLKKSKSSESDGAIEKFLSGPVTFQEVKKWNFKSCRIGQQVLSTIARRMFGTPEPTDANVYGLFVYFLRRQMKSIHAAGLLLDDVKPDTVIFNEANDSHYGALFDLAFAKRMDIIQFVQPFQDDALIFKRFNAETKGLHPNSLSKSTFAGIRPLPWTEKHEEALWNEFSLRYSGKWFLSQRNQLGKIDKDKEAIIRQLGLDRSKKTAIVFSHILWDANLFYGEDIFKDYEDWFIETVQAACKNPRVNWVIKMHPSNIWKRNREKVKGELREAVLIREKIGNLPSHVYLLYPDVDINTFSLFKIADYGITVRGTVGMELPCFGKPIFTAGTGRYSGLGFTIDSSTKAEYLEKLDRIESFLPLTADETLLAKKHAYAVFVLRPWRMQSFRAAFNYQKQGIHPLDHNLFPMIHSSGELANAEDIRKFKDWTLHSDTPDYIEDWYKFSMG